MEHLERSITINLCYRAIASRGRQEQQVNNNKSIIFFYEREKGLLDVGVI